MKLTDRILVTGSEGFIGTHVMELLGKQGIRFDIRKHAFMDINDAGMFKALIFDKKPKAIIHLAAISNREDTDKDPQLALRTNIIGSFNVMRIAHEYGIRVIVASSAATAEPDRSIYGTSKDAMEHLAHMFFNVTIARLFNVYGDGGKGVINKWVEQIKRNEAITLFGNTSRDYIHVSDVAKQLVDLANKDVYRGTWEIGTGKTTKLTELVSIISKTFADRIITVNRKETKDEIQDSQMKGKPFSDTISLEEGIERLIK